MTRTIIGNLLKILIVFVILQALALNTSYVQAFSFGEIFETGENFIETGENAYLQIENEIERENEKNKEQQRDEKLKEISSAIYNTLLGIGITLSVVVGAILGIKFMISSVDEKAQIKEALVAYVAGCVVIFGAFGIWKLVITLGNSLNI